MSSRGRGLVFAPRLWSIIAMVKRRVAGGMVMMILVLTFPPICMFADLAIELPKAIRNAMDEKNGAPRPGF
jgi:hypothetical protein